MYNHRLKMKQLSKQLNFNNAHLQTEQKKILNRQLLFLIFKAVKYAYLTNSLKIYLIFDKILLRKHSHNFLATQLFKNY